LRKQTFGRAVDLADRQRERELRVRIVVRCHADRRESLDELRLALDEPLQAPDAARPQPFETVQDSRVRLDGAGDDALGGDELLPAFVVQREGIHLVARPGRVEIPLIEDERVRAPRLLPLL
jgi:hypothetical protein